MVCLQKFLVFAPCIIGAATQSTTTTSAVPQSTACGVIVNDPEYNIVFNASLVYECLASVPFNGAVATKFIKYYNDTLSFQSTLAYLKNPPPSYQQPSTDLMAGLHQLQSLIDSDFFPNQYEFEAALQILLYSAHDSHLYLQAGILAAFSFAGPFDIVSMSVDGIQLPKVYRKSDVVDSDSFRAFEPSAIKTINGQDATIYLESFAANNSVGNLEPHADWNQLMWSPVQDILYNFNAYGGGATFYPGDTTTIEHENGTTYTEKNLAVYWSQGPTGPLTTGGDFYNFFVLGFYPASFDPESLDDESGTDETASAESTTQTSTTNTATASVVSPSPSTTPSWRSSAYPTPDVAQPDLGEEGGGYISGYFFSTQSLAVLSIPSFNEYGAALGTWASTIDEFISKSQAAGLEEILIDLQNNGGGQVLLALDAFERFFPNIAPFGGSRLRAQHAANIMGSTLTDYFQSLNSTNDDYSKLAADEWVATTRINADTHRNFTSWSEFFGPHIYNNDNFTTTQHYNLSNLAFINSALDSEGYTIDDRILSEHDDLTTPPYDAKNIILLTDGSCGSSCAIFLELMHYYAGVRVVTVGGQPRTGPIQGASGSRGARVYDTIALDDNIGFVQKLLAGNPDASADMDFLPNRTEALDVFVVEATVNLRDQVRPGGTTPLQFLYDAADCRIFFTPQTVTNMSALWLYAADAMWSNGSLCVDGSTGYAVTAANSTSGITAAPTNTASAFDLTDYLASVGNTTGVPEESLDGPLDDLNLRPRKLDGLSHPRDCQNIGGHCSKHELCVPIDGCSSDRGYCITTCSNANSRYRTCGGSVKGTCGYSSYSLRARESLDYLGHPQALCWPDSAPPNCRT